MSRPITFTGLASGVDSGAIVDQLMTIERRPSVALQGSIDAAGARITALAGIQASLNALRAAEQGLRGPGAFAAAPSATSSDPARVAVTATADAVQTSYSVTVEQLARADVVTQGSSLAAASAADVLHLTGGGSAVDVAVGAGDSIDTIASRVNATGGGVTASVVGGKLRLTSTPTGAAAAIAVSSDGSLAADLAFAGTLAGRDAHFTVDGTAYVRATNTVSDVLVGATMTLKAATGAPVAVATDPAGRNPDAIVGQMQGLVTAYNAVLDGVASSTSDSLLYGIRDQLQRATQDPVAGAALRQAAAIGLSTGASTGSIAAGSLSGKLVLDEAQLRTAIGRDPDAVATLVDGLATRLDGVIASAGGALQGRTGAENARIAEYHASLDQMTVRLDDRERRLRAQFTAMEQSLAQLKSLQAQFPSTFA